MRDLLKAYKEKRPEVVFEWSDPKTEARGWVVINSLRNGAAGGGTRMRKGLTKEEVVSLAKVMEIKFSVSGPPIGGAKSGIDFDPNDPRRREVLERWFKAVFPLLKNYYGTGGDLNVDEIKDVVPITEDLGLWHPQEGVVRGHLNSEKGEKIQRIGQLRYGCEKIIEDPAYAPVGNGTKYAIADMVTGYGVAESVQQFYKMFKKSDLKDKRVIIQGWGNVASAAAFYLCKMGALIVGIIDKDGGIISKNGFNVQEVEDLFHQKAGNKLVADNMMSFEEINEKIWDVPADIFIPGAASKIVTRDQVDRMIDAGVELISCGANVPFVDDEVFFGPTAEYTDQRISVIPDFIANCGMARVFAYLMEANVDMTDAGIFEDIAHTIYKALHEVHDLSIGTTRISEKALEIALLRSLRADEYQTN
jgi:glutamate dehydrogenase/leucine dehydrogenase